MKTVEINNVTIEGYDFTEDYIEAFSATILEAAIKAGLFEALSSAKSYADGKMPRPFNFSISLPDRVICVATIANNGISGLQVSAKFFNVDLLAQQAPGDPFDGHSAIAFLQFGFDVLSESFVERKLASAEMLILDGFADQMFVAMMLKDDPQAFDA